MRVRRASAFLLTALSLHAAAGYDVTTVALPNIPLEVNNVGQMVGGNGSSYIGTVAGITSPIPPVPGFSNINARALNDSGQVTGTVQDGLGQFQAFVGSAAGSSLIPLLPGLTWSVGTGINSSGQVAGFGTLGSNGPDIVFIGTAAGSTEIPVPSGWRHYATTNDNPINNAGQVAATGLNPTTGQAFIGTVGGSTPVPVLPGWTNTSAWAINNSGQLAGIGFNGGGLQAFIGNAAGVTPIPLAGGATSLSPFILAINDLNQVVGVNCTPAFCVSPQNQAWIWDSSNGTRLLNDLVPAGWSIYDLFDINDVGQILALGNFQNGPDQFLLLSPQQTPDLTITKTHLGNFAQGQSSFTYTMTVSNTGTGATIGTITVAEMPPVGLSAASMSGTGWSCTQPSGPCTRNDTLAAGSSYPPITFSGSVAVDAPSFLTNVATVAGGGETNTTNNTASDPTSVIQNPPAIFSVSPNPVPGNNSSQTMFINGSGFQSGTGLTVRLTSPSGHTDLQGGQVSFVNSAQLVIVFSFGILPATWGAEVINPDAQHSSVASFSVANATAPASLALPQFVFGGGWYSALYFSNTTNAPATVQVDFTDDFNSVLPVPLVGIGTVTAQTVNLNPGATAVLEALNGGNPSEGWVHVSMPAGVIGYGVFRQVVPGRFDQEALVPFTPQSGQTADFSYDDLQFTTSVALLNPGNQQVVVSVTAYGADGAQVGTTQISLSPGIKSTSVLKAYPGMAGIFGKQGRVVVSAPNGAVSVLALRFGGSAFTNIPINYR